MIEVRGLVKTYADGKRALAGIDLDIADGMLGLLGPNGSGKTTMLSLLVLALEPSAGTIRYLGLDQARARDRSSIRRLIGYLPQDFVPIGHLTGREYLVHCARLRGIALTRRALAARVSELLEAVSLSEAAGRRAGTYSGGMRRRLGIAQALIHAPRLLVVDEPTAGLDPEERLRFRNLVADVADRTAVLLSTHIVEDIETTCPRIVIIGGGRLLFDGEPTELLRATAGRLWDLPPGESPAAGAVVIGRRLHGSGEVVVTVAGEECPAGGAPREPTLEDAYASFLARHGIESSEDAATPGAVP